MKIRRYIANNMQEALLKVKMDLGPDAVILNTRKMKRPGMFSFLRSPLIEVLASLEEEENEGKEIVEASNAKVEQLENKVHNMEEMLAKIYKQMSERPVESVKSTGEKNSSDSSNIYHVFVDNMRQNDVEESVISDIVQALRQKGIDNNSSMNEAFSIFQKELISRLGVSQGIVPEENKKPKVIMFLGPTGVGKTTTLAKLAANFMIKEKKKVGMITADTYRIAAVEQLKTYSEIMGTSITVIYSPKEMKDAIKKHSEDDLILIDTPGKSHKNKKHFDEIKEIVRAAEPDETYLLISATTKMKDCREIIKAYSFIDNYKLIFTKIDETSSLGVVLNVKEITGKPLSYVTTGQSVPDDIEMIDVENLSKKLLGNS
ncbi:MAG: flagellar biosynthesis protein FlhF [Clostridia bacterium]|nr:flagellar biosynthesis protein FlhF [Clostridia bacterium]